MYAIRSYYEPFNGKIELDIRDSKEDWTPYLAPKAPPGAPNGFPGQHARIPDECATVAQLLQDAGWSTFWVGKNHNVPETDVTEGSTKKQWPLAKGFDRFYGFIGGETNQWYPDLILDNHSVELSEHHKPGFTRADEADDGYHLSKDMADKAIQMIKDQKASNPSYNFV